MYIQGDNHPRYTVGVLVAALGCQVPSKFEIFKQLEPEEVHERLSKLHEWYQQL